MFGRKEKGYLGNPLLKPSNTPIQFTQDQIQEYIRCKNDPVYFIRKYVKIINIDDGLVPFNLHPYQENLVETTHKNRFVICKFGRQSGKSTTIAAYFLYYLTFNPDKTAAILANKLSTAREILSRFQRMYENLPAWLQQGVKEWNKTSTVFENNSKIIAAATSSSAIRGQSINLLLLDEFAHIHPNQAEEFYASVFPTISSGRDTKVIVVSTPYGLNHFYRMWNEAESGRSDYVPLEVLWHHVPGRDENWRDAQIRQTSIHQFDQEHNCHFLGSSNTLISGPFLRTLSPRNEIYTVDDLCVFEEPQPDHIYTMICDVSRGSGIDYSAFLVIDITEIPYRIVARYRNNTIPPQVYPDVIYRTGQKYNKAWVLIETNDAGGQVSDYLHSEMEYDNMITVSMRGRSGQIADSGFGGKSYRGIKTTSSVKRIGCQTLKTLVEDKKIIVDDIETIMELSTFIATRNTYEAEPGHHDDLSMCLVLFSWLTTQPIFKELANQNSRELLYQERLRQLEDDMTPFGFVLDGLTDENNNKYIDATGQVWDVVNHDGGGSLEDSEYERF